MNTTLYFIIIFGAGIFVGSITYLFGYKAGKAYQEQRDMRRINFHRESADKYLLMVGEWQLKYFEQMRRANKAEKLSDFWRDQFLARYPLPEVDKRAYDQDQDAAE